MDKKTLYHDVSDEFGNRKNHREKTQYEFVITPMEFKTSVDFIETWVKYLLSKHQHEFVSLMLRNIPVAYYPSDLLVSLLKTTLSDKKLITYRDKFWTKVKYVIELREEDASSLENLK